jgi:hypothetical protein
MKGVFFIILTMMFSSCAVKKMAVDNADTLLTHQITKRLPLYSKQKEKLSKDMDKFLNDQKLVAQEILPHLDEMEINSEEMLIKKYQTLEASFMQISKNFSNLMSKYMAQLDEKQQKDFFETLDDENREILKKEKEKRIDEVEDRFEIFLGKLSGPQKQIIREYKDYYHSRAKDRLDRRVKLHEKFRATYNYDISESTKVQQFQEAFTEYQEETRSGSKNLEIMKRILPTVSKKQREQFRKRVEEVKDIIKYYLSVDY